MTSKANLINEEFTYGVVKEKIGRKPGSEKIFWKLLCKCGSYYETDTSSLRSQNTRSCGCLSKKLARERKYTGYKNITGTFFGSIKCNAKNSGKIFHLTIEYVWDLYEQQNRKCKFSGIELTFTDRNKDINGNASLDRIDSNKGYIVGNVQWIDKRLNSMKSDMSDQEFIYLCKTVADYQKSNTQT